MDLFKFTNNFYPGNKTKIMSKGPKQEKPIIIINNNSNNNDNRMLHYVSVCICNLTNDALVCGLIEHVGLCEVSLMSQILLILGLLCPTRLSLPDTAFYMCA